MEVSPDTPSHRLSLMNTAHRRQGVPILCVVLGKVAPLLLFLQPTLTACKSLFLELQFSSMKLVKAKGFVSMLKISVISLLSISKRMQLNH